MTSATPEGPVPLRPSFPCRHCEALHCAVQSLHCTCYALLPVSCLHWQMVELFHAVHTLRCNVSHWMYRYCTARRDQDSGCTPNRSYDIACPATGQEPLEHVNSCDCIESDLEFPAFERCLSFLLMPAFTLASKALTASEHCLSHPV